jgi:hypothetical protein
MATSLLNLVGQVLTELNFSAPTAVIGNNNKTVSQVFALLKRAGKELVKEYEWQILQKNYRFTTFSITTTGDTVAGSNQILNVPSNAALVANPGYFNVSPAAYFPQDTQVSSVLGTTVTCSQPANTTQLGGTIYFSQQIYPMPSDYEAMIPRTHWDKSKRWAMLGPESPQQREWLKSGYISTGPRLRWWIQGNTFQLWPNIVNQNFGGTTGEYLGFEYRSNSAITSAAGVAQADYLADTDLNELDETVLVYLTKKKYFEIKGFDTESLTQDYMRILSIAKANDRSAQILSFSPYPSEVLIGYQNIPDSGYGT